MVEKDLNNKGEFMIRVFNKFEPIPINVVDVVGIVSFVFIAAINVFEVLDV